MPPLIPLLVSLAPTVASWIFGDKTGKAVEQVTDIATRIFGTDDAGAIERAIATDPAKALEFKTALIKAESEARRMEHDELIARIQDVASARAQTVELAKAGSVIAWGAPIVSIIVLATFGWVLKMVLTATIPAGQENLIYIMLGALTTMATGVVGYWVGSTAGSAQKTSLIAAPRK